MYDISDILLYKGVYNDMSEDMIDSSTGILLTPSFHGEDCLGNGEHTGYACCCDECDYYAFRTGVPIGENNRKFTSLFKNPLRLCFG